MFCIIERPDPFPSKNRSRLFDAVRYRALAFGLFQKKQRRVIHRNQSSIVPIDSANEKMDDRLDDIPVWIHLFVFRIDTTQTFDRDMKTGLFKNLTLCGFNERLSQFQCAAGKAPCLLLPPFLKENAPLLVDDDAIRKVQHHFFLTDLTAKKAYVVHLSPLEV